MHSNLAYIATFSLLLFTPCITAAICVRGPKYAGSHCEDENKGLLTCGPGSDGNLVRPNSSPKTSTTLSI